MSTELRPLKEIRIFAVAFEPSSVALRIMDSSGKIEHYIMKLTDLQPLGLQLLTDGVVLERLPKAVQLLSELSEGTAH